MMPSTIADAARSRGSAPDGRTRASHLLERASSAGLVTSIDIVSTEHPRFREIVLSALPYTDHLLINEVEASRVLDRAVDPADPADLLAAARDLLAEGVRAGVVLHTEYGAASARTGGEFHIQGAVAVPPRFIRGANGAGDAFAAGYLHGIHENYPLPAALELAVCTAAACLAHASPSAGLFPIHACLALGRGHGFSTFCH